LKEQRKEGRSPLLLKREEKAKKLSKAADERPTVQTPHRELQFPEKRRKKTRLSTPSNFPTSQKETTTREQRLKGCRNPKRDGQRGAALLCLKGRCSVVLELKGRAGACIDARAALDALVGLLGVEPGVAVLELKEGVGAGVDAGAASDAIASDLGVSRHV